MRALDRGKLDPINRPRRAIERPVPALSWTRTTFSSTQSVNPLPVKSSVPGFTNDSKLFSHHLVMSKTSMSIGRWPWTNVMDWALAHWLAWLRGDGTHTCYGDVHRAVLMASMHTSSRCMNAWHRIVSMSRGFWPGVRVRRAGSLIRPRMVCISARPESV